MSTSASMEMGQTGLFLYPSTACYIMICGLASVQSSNHNSSASLGCTSSAKYSISLISTTSDNWPTRLSAARQLAALLHSKDFFLPGPAQFGVELLRRHRGILTKNDSVDHLSEQQPQELNHQVFFSGIFRLFNVHKGPTFSTSLGR